MTITPGLRVRILDKPKELKKVALIPSNVVGQVGTVVESYGHRYGFDCWTVRLDLVEEAYYYPDVCLGPENSTDDFVY